MIEMEGLARKYASALMKQYHWHERDIMWVERLRAVAQFLREHRQRFLHAPRSLYITILEVFGLNDASMQSCIILLERQQRLLLLADVLLRVIDIYKQWHDIEYCRISSAAILNDQQSENIKKLLELVSGKKLLCLYKTDPSLIAGIRARSETFVWEDSIEQRLRLLEQI